MMWIDYTAMKTLQGALASYRLKDSEKSSKRCQMATEKVTQDWYGNLAGGTLSHTMRTLSIGYQRLVERGCTRSGEVGS